MYDAAQPGDTVTPAGTTHHPMPPRPRATLRVGVSGHRPNKLDGIEMPVLRGRIADVLDAIAGAASDLVDRVHKATRDYADEPLSLRIVSALAEGADRVIVDEAFTLGYELQAPLPFAREEYAKDFADDASRARFERYLRQATAVLELDGTREQGAGVYAEVGRAVLGQSDVLVAIWNGESAAGPGGTGEVVLQAVALGIPVVWIHTRAPHPVRVIRAGSVGTGSGESLDVLARELERILQPPRADGDVVRDAYFRDTPPPVRRAWRAFRWIRRNLGPHVDSIPLPEPLVRVPERLWADALAEYYGANYRDAFVWNYLLGAAAVCFALLGYVAPLMTLLELACIATVLSLFWLSRRHCWHERWLNFRLLAEQFRQLEMLWPLGATLPSFRAPAHAADEDMNYAWVTWLFRARVRERGLVNAQLTPEAVRRYVDEDLRLVIDGQAQYHRENAERSGHIAHALHRIAASLFVATLVVCVLHFALDLRLVWHERWFAFFMWESLEHAARPVLDVPLNAIFTFLAAALPAFGAAAVGIAGQAEFARLARRSSAMATHLGELSRRLAAPATSTSRGYAQIAEQAADAMVAELLDWRVTFQLKPIEVG